MCLTTTVVPIFIHLHIGIDDRNLEAMYTFEPKMQRTLWMVSWKLSFQKYMRLQRAIDHHPEVAWAKILLEMITMHILHIWGKMNSPSFPAASAANIFLFFRFELGIDALIARHWFWNNRRSWRLCVKKIWSWCNGWWSCMWWLDIINSNLLRRFRNFSSSKMAAIKASCSGGPSLSLAKIQFKKASSALSIGNNEEINTDARNKILKTAL